jgi:dihydrolipoamide dehydrogenase
MTDRDVNVLVIGAGPGGYPAAIRSAQLGLSTIIVEKSMWGGTCLNIGCVPSKALITAGKMVEKTSKMSQMGISVGDVAIDMGAMQAWKSQIVGKMTGGVQQLCKGNGAELINGTATLTSANTATIATADGDLTIKFDTAILATGSVPIEIPTFTFDETTILSSTGALDLPEVPDHVVVIGGGYIGLEMGQMLEKLGSKITVVEMAGQVLPGFDPEVVRVVARKMKKDGIVTHLSARAEGWEQDGDRVAVNITKKDGTAERIVCDKVLVTVGRRPYSAGLGLDVAGVKQDDRGFVPVDSQLRTNIPNILAVGDLTGNPMLAHRATKQGEIAGEVAAGKAVAADYKTVPAVVFTDPEIASAGLDEAEAKAKGFTVKVGKFPWSANARALTQLEGEGFVKIVADAADNQVLGVLIVGPNASDLISEAALAIEMDAFVEDISLTIHPHPTLGEAVMEAANKILGHPIHIM